MPDAAADPEIYSHLRIVLGVGLSLSLARLLTGLARFVQHPGRIPVYPVHLGWAVFMILEVLHFWWFEFALGHLHDWTFWRYCFVVAFASLHFVIATVLFPDDLWEYGTYHVYFLERRAWFFGLILAYLVCDQFDTVLKGRDYYAAQGLAYPVKQAFIAVLAIMGIGSRSERLQALAVTAALVAEIAWIAWRHLSLGPGM